MPLNFIQSILEFLSEFWPFVIVEQWERGVLQVLGRVQERGGWFARLANRLHMGFREENGCLKPGLYFIIPWFSHVECVDIVVAPISTPLHNITLKDQRTLSYSATALVQVTDPIDAITQVDDYKESASELVSSKLSEKLADVDGTRLDPENRRRLLPDLLRWCNEDTQQYGVTVLGLRFTNFALNQRAYRLLTDSAVGALAW